MTRLLSISQLFLRLALGIGFIVPGVDRLGWRGPNGSPGVFWGDWEHFSAYAQKLMFFLPDMLSNLLAIVATVAELLFGILLIVGLATRWVAIGSGILALAFALCMAISLGISAPLGYSVFTVSAACFLLATVIRYCWSLDEFIVNKKISNHYAKR